MYSKTGIHITLIIVLNELFLSLQSEIHPESTRFVQEQVSSEAEHNSSKVIEQDRKSDQLIEWNLQIDRTLQVNESYDPDADEYAHQQQTSTESSKPPTIISSKKSTNESDCKEYFNEGRYEKCVSCFNDIIESGSYSAKHYRSRGLARTRLDEPDLRGAIEDFDKSLDIEPNSVRALYLLGRTNLALEKYDEAVESLNLARQRAEEQQLIADEKHQVFLMLEKACIKTVEARSTNLEAWNLLGLSSRELGKYDEAMETLKKALQIAENLMNNIRISLKETEEKKEIEAARKEAEEERYEEEMAIRMMEEERQAGYLEKDEEAEVHQKVEETTLKLLPQDASEVDKRGQDQLQKQKDETILTMELDARKEQKSETEELTRGKKQDESDW